MLLLHLSSCWQLGGWLMKPQFSTIVCPLSYRLSGVMNGFRFSLLWSAVQCIQGAHSSIGVFNRAPPPMDLVQVESHLSE